MSANKGKLKVHSMHGPEELSSFTDENGFVLPEATVPIHGTLWIKTCCSSFSSAVTLIEIIAMSKIADGLGAKWET